MFVRKNLFVATAFVLASLVLSSCSNATNITSAGSSSPKPEAPVFPKITQTQFDSALDGFDATKDEFDGTIRIDPNNGTFVKLLKAQPKKDGTYFSLATTIQSVGKAEGPELTILAGLAADSWWFHRSVDVKSTNGVYHFDVDTGNRQDTVQGGGLVTEISNHDLSSLEAREWCRVLDGNDLKAQFKAGASTTHTNAIMALAPLTVKVLRSSCTLYFGLEQGLSSPKIPK
jgi:hypothetical protein